jgi:hypothetical protein
MIVGADPYPDSKASVPFADGLILEIRLWVDRISNLLSLGIIPDGTLLDYSCMGSTMR